MGTKQVSLEFLTYDSPLSKKLAEYMKNQLEQKQQAIPTNAGTRCWEQKKS
ncbi:hypothetical protein C2W64_02752 [Brevibacillus laterosporus]|nr:hypothetical protein C2W64_02752 [Brevibacillus laterosporus]